MSVTTPQHHRVGAHRARRNPLAVTAAAAAGAVVLVAVLIWGLTAAGLFGDNETSALGDGTDLGLPGAEQSLDVLAPTDAAQPVLPAPTTDVTVPPVVVEPPPPVVDQAATVTVLNGGVTVPRVARRTAERLVAGGWTGVDVEATANAPTNVAATIVAFGDPALQATAEAVAATLGTGAATLTTDYASAGILTQIVVVLGPEFVEPAA